MHFSNCVSALLTETGRYGNAVPRMPLTLTTACLRHSLNPSQEGRYSIYVPRRDGRLSYLDGWLHTETIYVPAASHPSK